MASVKYSGAQGQRAIRTGVDYASALEYGTVRMAPRPYMGPTAAWLQGELTRIFRDFYGGVR